MPMFRFTIRDVLWLTVAVALAVGWGIDRSRLSAENQNFRAVEAIRAIKMEME